MRDENANSDEVVRLTTKDGRIVEARAYVEVLDNGTTYTAVRTPDTLDEIATIEYRPRPSHVRANVVVPVPSVERPAAL